ncbi:hypothetical protein J5N97_014150 [Dioscorea zingiberensis]|uniref:Uncharacterized protein n=1 Tax=Dioscorea zingiberensis TaxID=325984 RepID=A0A9D5HJF7_9LILI|nr:hypothetical protein J5N97_014150 [Dioscorea zingiberensis]
MQQTKGSTSPRSLGSLSRIAEVFELTPSLYIVELRKSYGDPSLYRQLYTKLKEVLEFRFLQGEPRLYLRLSAEAQWTAHHYNDEGWTVIDWHTLEGMDRMVFVLTSDDRVAVVELTPELKATLLEADVGWDSSNDATVLYFADVYDDMENEIAGVMFMVKDKKILELVRMF